jgi:hypothetical protein
MQIYLAKPGGQKEGPFTLDQINNDLAAKKYGGNDYWAWYEGLPSWMPLHSLPGVTGRAVAVAPAAAPQPSQAAEPPKAIQAPPPKPAAPVVIAPVEAKPEPKPAEPPKPAEVAEAAPAPATPAPASELADPAAPLMTAPSGLPFSALEQVFIFTTGEGRSVFESQLASHKLEDATGEAVEKIREMVQVNVVGRVDAGVEMMNDGSIPDKAWRAISAIKPEIAERAKAGAYDYCVRTVLSENNDVVTLLLFYKK